MIKRPSQRTLSDYTYYTLKLLTGFTSEIDKQLMEAARINSCPEREKYVAVIIDEMHIKEDIMYDKHTGKFNQFFTLNSSNKLLISGSVIGFSNLGELNSHLLAFMSKLLKGDEETQAPLANFTLVFLIGVCLAAWSFHMCSSHAQRYRVVNFMIPFGRTGALWV